MNTLDFSERFSSIFQSVINEHIGERTLLIGPIEELLKKTPNGQTSPDTPIKPIKLLQNQKKTKIDILPKPEKVDDLATITRYDLIVLYRVVEALDKPVSEQIIARLRNIHCKHLLVFMEPHHCKTATTTNLQPSPQDSPLTKWRDSDFYSLGFSRYDLSGKDLRHKKTVAQDKENLTASHHTDLLCYSYNIKHYNKKRQWNNAKNWANPENFGKYWW